MIPAVVAGDLVWAGMVTAMYVKAPSPKMRKLTRIAQVYVLIEVLFHARMETFLADCLTLLL